MTLLATAYKYRAQLMAHEATTTRTLEAVHAHMVQSLTPHLSALYDAIAAQQGTGKLSPTFLYQGKRLAHVTQAVDHAVGQYATFATATITQSQQFASHLATQSTSAQLAYVLSPSRHMTANTPDVTEHLIKAMGNVAALVASYAHEAATAVKSAFVVGVSLGSTVKAIDKQVTRAIDASRWRSVTVAATAPVQVYRATTLVILDANFIPAWMWVSDKTASVCFPADTVIQTKRGPVRIDHISLGEEVLTHTGCYKRVVAKKKTPYQGVMYTIHTEQGSVTATSEHPFLVERQGKLDWIEACNIRLSDHVICQLKSTSEVSNHRISDNSIERHVGQSDYTVSSRLQPERLSSVSFSNARFRMPVYSINLKTSIQRRQKEIDGITPALESVLLPIIDTQRLEAQSSPSFGFSLTGKLAVASRTAERSIALCSRSDAKLFSAISTTLHKYRTVALLRAVLIAGNYLMHDLPAPLTGSVYRFGIFTRYGTVDLSLLTQDNRKVFSAYRTGFRDMPMNIKAFSRTILPRVIMSHPKRFTTYFARKVKEWFSLFPSAGMRVLSLVSDITRLRAEVPGTSFSPSIGLGDGFFTYDTSCFHATSVSSSSTHVQSIFVYNLEVEEDHSYVANGFVVHNCDVCFAMDGTQHPIDEDMDSHPRCHCIPIPLNDLQPIN